MPSVMLIMTNLFEKDLLKFAFNKHATHVLIKFIKLADIHPFLDKIYAIIVQNLPDLSQDPNGLPVIKNTIQKFYIKEDTKSPMIEAMSASVVVLS
jgi:hypothetical protein